METALHLVIDNLKAREEMAIGEHRKVLFADLIEMVEDLMSTEQLSLNLAYQKGFCDGLKDQHNPGSVSIKEVKQTINN